MPTPHGRVTIITPPETEVAIAELMKATGRHKSAVLKEALDLGLTALKDRHQLTASKRVSEMTEDQLRAIVRQEIATALREEIKVNHEIKIETNDSNSTANQLRQIMANAAKDATGRKPKLVEFLTEEERRRMRGNS
jgi:hypothetical protein